MISYDNVKIMVIDTREGEYNHKKQIVYYDEILNIEEVNNG